MLNLYIAYGSNLCKRAMRRRCPGARPLGAFYLTNAKLVFRGVADIEYSPGNKAACGLWSITKQDERALDAYEGVDSGLYFKNRDIILKYDGEPVPALIYLMSSTGVYPPNEFYVDTIREGYKNFDLDEQYLDRAIEQSFLEKDPDAQTIRRRKRDRDDPKRARLVKMPEAVALARLEQLRPINWNEARDTTE